jgi:hypothetical protein
MKVLEDLNKNKDSNIFIQSISGKVDGGSFRKDPREVSTKEFPYTFRIYKDGLCLVTGHSKSLIHAMNKMREFKGASIRLYDRKTQERVR